jgi:indole-3-glycerol phosphate synthase
LSTQVPTVLERILAQTREELARRKREAPLQAPQGAARAARPFRDSLSAAAIGVIAEFKRSSPSAGELRAEPDLEQMVSAYARGGAVALSILTEGPNFSGSLADLRAARELCGLPLLRKDFIVDPYQLLEARLAGADAVLLIVAALTPQELVSLRRAALDLGLEALVEVHDEQELEIALAAGAEIVGINNRDLRDFTVDVGRTEGMLDAIPPGVLVVSESGIARPEQLRRLQERGVDAVLVGELLMRAPDPAGALEALSNF